LLDKHNPFTAHKYFIELSFATKDNATEHQAFIGSGEALLLSMMNRIAEYKISKYHKVRQIFFMHLITAPLK
jgi:hypothetical protein